MEYNFSKTHTDPTQEVKIGDHTKPQVTKFKYFESILQNNGKVDGDVNHRIQANEMEECFKKVSPKLKGKFYQTTIRLAMFHDIKC
ncbi:hypothetical protein Lal_00029999 [Lupinus albus]|nr:hypothetical protein Lal_00029999 [Lupinus albus]